MLNKKQTVNTYDISKEDEDKEKKEKEQEKNNPNKPITRNELRSVLKAMDKDGFSNILGEYINEISDPNNVKETNQFLLESEQKRDLPPNVTLAKPNIGFCIKTEKKQIGKGNQREKIFINICSLNDVPKPEEVKMSDGSSWSLPYLVNKPRNDLDSKKRHCLTFDVIFNPFAIEMSTKYKPFKKFVCDNAINGINKNFLLSKNEEASQDYIIINKYDYKGNDISLINIHGLKAKQFDDKREDINEYKSQMMKDLEKVKEEEQYKEFDQVDITETKIQNVNKTVIQENKISNEEKEKIKKEKKESEETTKLKNEKEKIEIPKYIIKYVDKFDLVNYFYDPNGTNNEKSKSYSEMVIEIYLSKVDENFNVGLAELEYKDKIIYLNIKETYKLNLELKSELIEDTISASFDKIKKILFLKGKIKSKRNEIINENKFNDNFNENDENIVKNKSEIIDEEVDNELVQRNKENIIDQIKDKNDDENFNENNIETNQKKTVRNDEKLKEIKEMMEKIKQERNQSNFNTMLNNKNQITLEKEQITEIINKDNDLYDNNISNKDKLNISEIEENSLPKNIISNENVGANQEINDFDKENNVNENNTIKENPDKHFNSNNKIDSNIINENMKNTRTNLEINDKKLNDDVDDSINLNTKSSKLQKIHLIEFHNPLIYELV